MEAVGPAGEIPEQDLVAGPGAGIGEAAERVRVGYGGAADPRGGQVGAQLCPRPWPLKRPPEVIKETPEHIFGHVRSQFGAAYAG